VGSNVPKAKNAQPPLPPLPPWLKCGEVGTYSKLNEKRAEPKFERDHVPSKAAMNHAAQNKPKMKGVSARRRQCVEDRLESRALTIAIPHGLHRDHSRTCGTRNTKKQVRSDAKSLDKAAAKDLRKLQKQLKGTACEEPYREAAKQVRAQDHNKLINEVIDACKAAYR
jgi:hypothetical protein